MFGAPFVLVFVFLWQKLLVILKVWPLGRLEQLAQVAQVVSDLRHHRMSSTLPLSKVVILISSKSRSCKVTTNTKLWTSVVTRGCPVSLSPRLASISPKPQPTPPSNSRRSFFRHLYFFEQILHINIIRIELIEICTKTEFCSYLQA